MIEHDRSLGVTCECGAHDADQRSQAGASADEHHGLAGVLLGSRDVEVTERPDRVDTVTDSDRAEQPVVAGEAARYPAYVQLEDRVLLENEVVGAAAHPRMIRLVIAALHDDPARPWTAADMAELAGCSVRRLQEGFQAHVGSTPTQYLVDIRLQRAHAQLDTEPLAAVTDVALRWGFSSASRFAAAYKRRYGVVPSSGRRSPGR